MEGSVNILPLSIETTDQMFSESSHVALFATLPTITLKGSMNLDMSTMNIGSIILLSRLVQCTTIFSAGSDDKRDFTLCKER